MLEFINTPTIAHSLYAQFFILLYFIFCLVSWCRVRLGPLGTAATIWPIVPAPDDR
jgi:hypothetical protein